MNELNLRLQGIVGRLAAKPPEEEYSTGGEVEAIIQAFKANGWVKLPGNAQNVTITTSDNAADGKLMTEDEWREKYGQA